jgi:hypothetical protein
MQHLMAAANERSTERWNETLGAPANFRPAERVGDGYPQGC